MTSPLMTRSTSPPRSIDLNCDVGEAGGHDDSLIPLVSSINIACGGNANNYPLLPLNHINWE